MESYQHPSHGVLLPPLLSLVLVNHPPATRQLRLLSVTSAYCHLYKGPLYPDESVLLVSQFSFCAPVATLCMQNFCASSHPTVLYAFSYSQEGQQG